MNVSGRPMMCHRCGTKTERIVVGMVPACIPCGVAGLKADEKTFAKSLGRFAIALSFASIISVVVGVYLAIDAVTLKSVGCWALAVFLSKWGSHTRRAIDDQKSFSHHQRRVKLREAHEAWVAAQPSESVPVDPKAGEP